MIGRKNVERKQSRKNRFQIVLSVYECLPGTAQTLEPQLLTLSTYSNPKEPFSYSQDIKLKGLSTTLCITLTPGASPRSGRKARRPLSKSQTLTTSSQRGPNENSGS